MGSERESQEYIKNRNYLCDLLGKFKTIDGSIIEILTWSCNPYRIENAYSVTYARIRMKSNLDDKEIFRVPYDEILAMLGKERYVHLKK